MRSLLILILFLLVAAPARAGTYEHHTTSPSSPGLDGWSPSVAVPAGFAGTAAGPDALSAHFWGRPWFVPGDRVDWIYAPPPDTTVATWDVERMVAGIGGGHWNTLLSAEVDGHSRLVWADAPSQNRAWARVGAAGLGASRLVAGLHCGGPKLCVPAGTARLLLRRSRVVLHDPYAPQVDDLRGDLAEAGPLHGTVALSLHATDRGGGVYRAFAEVDGRAGPPVAIADGRCRDAIPGGDPYQFGFRQPCPLTAGATVAIDTTQLPDGPHAIAVKVEDAAGNEVTAYGPVKRAVDNVPAAKPPASPRPATPSRPVAVTAWFARAGRRHLDLTADYGERVRIRGRVADAAGRPVAGAALDIAERVDLPGRPWTALTGVRTRPDGRFTTILRLGPSRDLRMTAADGTAAPELTLHVRAPVTIRWARAPRRDGGTSRGLRGRLRCGFVPRGGAFVELQARARGHWTTRRVVRTFSSGRFSARVPYGTVRAVVPRQPGLPFARGVSPRRTAGRTAPRTSR